nr:immunoglobulin heavy chain junction region [Macaca mulatta]MOW95124.1 immunoglobulin heavy chain junction region [Macaca mulatta]MOW95409.1 immunoglobulin heavy chain junction region [Macaca mulatta]MOW95796.1 immunoglobulin heavy chain junction region [Macaca mulatta]MOW96068.1 immunoglobulin heavy chain junction region [Macaca mulatta]
CARLIVVVVSATSRVPTNFDYW